MSLAHIALTVLVVFIWSVNFVIIQFGLESLPPILFSAIRFWLTALPWIFFVKPPPINRLFIIYASGTFALQFGLLFTAMQLGASAGLSSLILQVQVFLTMLLAAIFLGEKISTIQLIGLGVACSGLILIIAHLGGDMPLISFVLIILAAAAWASGNIASKQLTGINAIRLVIWGGLVAAIPLTIMSLIVETEAWQWYTFTHISVKSAFAIVYVVCLSTFFCYGLWGYLLQKNPAGEVAKFTLLVPVFGMTASAILVGETLTWWKITAALLIISGLLISRIKRN